jgi:hypothetical protein
MEPQSSLSVNTCSYDLGCKRQQKCVSRWSTDPRSLLRWVSGMPRTLLSDHQALAWQP